MVLDQIKALVINKKREIHKHKHPAARSILAEFKDDKSKDLVFDSLNGLAKHLKGDRGIIRSYKKKQIWLL